MKTENERELTPSVAVRRNLFLKWITFLLVAVVAVICVVAFADPESQSADKDAAPIFVKEIPPGYRDWKVVSVVHEAGDLNDIRAVLAGC
jgi:hypothetical protein